MPFEPQNEPLDFSTWKPSPELTQMALRRCNFLESGVFDDALDPKELIAALVVSCYYQGMRDGVKHMARKQREEEKNAKG